MTQNVQSVIHEFGELTHWIQSLFILSDEKWREPIKEDKWSPSEVIAHLTGWDQYMKDYVIPAALKGEVVFPEHNEFNAKSSIRAFSGISKTYLIEEALQTRVALVKDLLCISEQDLQKHITVNGFTNCPNTNNPFTLLHLIEEFIEHDKHHKGQIVQYLS